MNKDFTLDASVEKVFEKGKVESKGVLRLSYKGVCIAKWTGGEEDKPWIDTLPKRAEEYIKTHGYLAEWRRRWNLQMFEEGTNWVQWDESLRVDIS